MSGLNPFLVPDLFNKIILGGHVSPGLVKLSGHDRNQDWQVNAAKGQTGATTSYNGEAPAQFTATFQLASDPLADVDDFVAWAEFQKVIESTTSGPSPFALPIYHPDLAAQRITEVTNGGVGGMVHDEKGGATVTVKFLEYRPPKKKTSGKPKSKGKPTDKTAAAANDIEKALDPLEQAQAELDGLVKEAEGP